MTLRSMGLLALVAGLAWTLATPPPDLPAAVTPATAAVINVHGSRAAIGPAAGVSGAADDHELGQSYVFLRVYDDSMVVRLEIAAADLERALAFGWDPDVPPEASQVNARLDSIRAYVEPRFALSADGNPLPLTFRGFDFRFVDFADYVLLEYVLEGPTEVPDLIEVRFAVLLDVDSQHRNMLVIEHNWKTGTFNNEAIVSLIFSPRNDSQTLDLTSSSVWTGFVAFIGQGVWHIWIGIDHILFLLALILPAVLMRKDGAWQPVPSFRRALLNIVKVVTFFTIAHSITLALAALDVVRLPSRPVESVIAASIAVAAWANLVPRLRIREWAVAFVFGLFHGFGFASVLGDIGMGREYLVLTLLGFNLGVELGQIAIIVAVFPVLFFLRRRKIYDWVLRGGSFLLIAIALYWFTERVFDIDIPVVDVLLYLPRLISGGG